MAAGERGLRDAHEAQVQRWREIMECMQMACWHGYPVRLSVDGVAYDGWVWGSDSPSSVVLCYGNFRYRFEWGEIEDVSFLTPLAERLTGSWLIENL